MSFNSYYYHFNEHRTKNPLMDERRTRMKEYSNIVTSKNTGIFPHYSYQNNENKYYNIDKYGYSNKILEKKEGLNKYNNKSGNRTNSLLNKNSNPNINVNNKNLTNNHFYGNDNFYSKKYQEYDSKYSLYSDKPNLNAKTEIRKYKPDNNDINDLYKIGKGYLDVGNKYIKDYIPNFSRINQPTYNQKNKENLLKNEFNELEKNDNKKASYLDEILFNKKDNEKLTSKYLDKKISKITSDLDNYKNKLIGNNIDNNNNKDKNINDIKINNEEKKDTNVESVTKDDYLEKYETQKSIAHNKSNINRSKSVAPNKNLTSENSKISNSLIGFNNLGATCYMNSALQNIIHCKSFIDKIKAFQNTNIINSQDKSITNSFLNLCNSLIDAKTKDTRRYLSYTYSLNSISPSTFKSNFCLKHKDYARGQHDSIEFLRTLLDDISKEININQNISAYKELTTEGKSKEEQSQEYHNFYKSRENSIVVDVFYNQIINIFTCSCKYESYSFQKLLDIPLLLPNKNYKIDFSSLINDYFKEEELDWSTKCEKCQKPELKHSKLMKFCILNEIVIFSLQRFDPVLSIKNNIRVSFKELIDLKDYCDADLYKDNTQYRLLGTINHIGNINYGHYYSYIRIGEIWYEFNDSIVQKVSRMDYDSSSVCVLFYEKINI